MVDGAWHHVVVTGDESDYKIYIDGVSYSINATHGDGDTGNWSNVTAVDNFTIGAVFQDSDSHTYLNGSITEVAIWNSAITATEVQAIFNDGKALDVSSDSGDYTSSGDLVGYWRNNGLATWTDLSGNSKTGTPTSLTDTLLIPAGVDGSRDNQGFLMNRQKDTNALNLPDSFDYVSAGDSASLQLAGASSISCWFKPYSATEEGYLVSKFDASTSGGYALQWQPSGADNKVRLLCQGETSVTSNAVFSDNNTWVHIVVTVDGSDAVIFYRNGVAAGTGTTMDLSANSIEFRVGTRVGGSLDTHYLKGSIDDVAIYSKALTAAEVTRNYNAGKRSHR